MFFLKLFSRTGWLTYIILNTFSLANLLRHGDL